MKKHPKLRSALRDATVMENFYPQHEHCTSTVQHEYCTSFLIGHYSAVITGFFFIFIITYTSTNYTKLKKNEDIYIKLYKHKN